MNQVTGVSTRNGESDYRTSHLEPGKGDSYDIAAGIGWRRLVWDWEQERLAELLTHFPEGRKVRLLDFACGTGRILSFLEDKVDTAIGVDISESMLAPARCKLERAQLIRADLTRENPLSDHRFDLITAFRFFLNAQPDLRSAVMKILAGHLADDGYLVFNNHLQRGSLPHRLFGVTAAIRGRSQDPSMSFEKSERLAEESGLRVVSTDHWGLLPAFRNRPLLPDSILRRLEGRCSRSARLRSLAQNLIVVCVKAE